jgi:hypothetical protein
VLLPSDTYRKPVAFITAVLLLFMTYLLTLPRISGVQWRTHPEFRETGNFIIVFNTARHWIILHKKNPVHIPLYNFFKNHSLLSSNEWLCLQSGLFHLGIQAGALYEFVMSQTQKGNIQLIK